MLKKTTLLSAVCLLLVGFLLLCADFNRYEKGTAAVPETQGGLIFSITAYDGGTESGLFTPSLGHAWLSLENRTGHAVRLLEADIPDGETITFSAWAISGHSGVIYNLEASQLRHNRRYSGRISLSVRIGEEQLAEIADYIRSNDTWTPTANCSRWSVTLWNRIAGQSCPLKTSLLVETPARLKKAIGEYPNAETDKDFSSARDAFFFQDGVRTELQLCS